MKFDLNFLRIFDVRVIAILTLCWGVLNLYTGVLILTFDTPNVTKGILGIGIGLYLLYHSERLNRIIRRLW